MVFNQRNDGTSACDLDYRFIAWACDVVTFRFQASFVTEDVQETIKYVFALNLKLH